MKHKKLLISVVSMVMATMSLNAMADEQHLKGCSISKNSNVVVCPDAVSAEAFEAKLNLEGNMESMIVVVEE